MTCSLCVSYRKKNQRELNRRLVGATLGDDDPEADDTRKWIKKSKKREKELAKKRQQEMDNLDNLYQEEYTESAYLVSFSFLLFSSLTLRLSRHLFLEDLAGLKVSHDLNALEEGENRILTLKDSRILDNQGSLCHFTNPYRVHTR